MKRFHIPAIDRLGRDSVKREMASRGYKNVQRTLNSWVQRRKLTPPAIVMLMEMAARRNIRLRMEDLQVIDRRKLEAEKAA